MDAFSLGMSLLLAAVVAALILFQDPYKQIQQQVRERDARERRETS